MSIITLLTDFGITDEYVGVMKGAILTVDPSATIVDITHHITPQNVLQAAYMIQSASPYFPDGTVHVVVVDPGVGSSRAIIAVKHKGHIFLAPDNGVLSAILNGPDVEGVVCVENTHYFSKRVSQTFHGRDIFAPVAGHLSSGVEMACLGRPEKKSRLVALTLQRPRVTRQGTLLGTIIAVDRFGNLITNIDTDSLKSMDVDSPDSDIEIWVRDNKIIGISSSYDAVENGEPLAVIGSRQYLEVAVNSGDAARQFKAGTGETVRLSIRKP